MAEHHNNNKNDDHAQTVYETAREEKVSELEILKQSLEEKRRQADEYYDQLLRLKAEFENFRKRAEKDKQNHLAWGKEEILLKQVSILDVLEQALSSSRSSTNIESIQKGLELIISEFNRMLTSEGIAEIESLGKPFDPIKHEAMEQVESEEPENSVVGVLQKGYMLGGKVVRPSKVKVAKTKKTDEKEHDTTLA